MSHTDQWLDAKISYNYCGICGHVPGKNDQPNRGPVRWWDPDDGWKFGTLCYACEEETITTEPDPKDYAYDDFFGQTSLEEGRSNFTRLLAQMDENIDTDEDITDLLDF